jgi:hypothetical protein
VHMRTVGRALNRAGISRRRPAPRERQQERASADAQ